MTTITINAMTHREVCCNQSDTKEAEEIYAKHAVEFFVDLANLARAHGFELDIEDRWPSARTYYITETESMIDRDAAHYFMRRHGDFWGWVAAKGRSNA